MKNFFTILAASALSSSSAFADGNIFEEYKTQANALAHDVTVKDFSIPVLIESNDRLIKLGLEIMKIYGDKYKSCFLQYEIFYSVIPELKKFSTDEIHLKYHDGEGLPAAPKHCYFGRSLVVHPAMSAVRLADGVLTTEDTEIIREESLEVASHIKTVVRQLGSN